MTDHHHEHRHGLLGRMRGHRHDRPAGAGAFMQAATEFMAGVPTPQQLAADHQRKTEAVGRVRALYRAGTIGREHAVADVQAIMGLDSRSDAEHLLDRGEDQ